MKMTVREYIGVFFKKGFCDFIRLYDYDGEWYDAYDPKQAFKTYTNLGVIDCEVQKAVIKPVDEDAEDTAEEYTVLRLFLSLNCRDIDL